MDGAYRNPSIVFEGQAVLPSHRVEIIAPCLAEAHDVAPSFGVFTIGSGPSVCLLSCEWLLDYVPGDRHRRSSAGMRMLLLSQEFLVTNMRFTAQNFEALQRDTREQTLQAECPLLIVIASPGLDAARASGVVEETVGAASACELPVFVVSLPADSARQDDMCTCAMSAMLLEVAAKTLGSGAECVGATAPGGGGAARPEKIGLHQVLAGGVPALWSHVTDFLHAPPGMRLPHGYGRSGSVRIPRPVCW